MIPPSDPLEPPTAPTTQRRPVGDVAGDALRAPPFPGPVTPPAPPPAPRGPLPEGTVTFLLTDIEGSTAAWEADRAAMAAAVARHYEILDGGIEACRGTRPVEQGEGDSVVAVFTRASDALRAAVDIQLALAAEAWPGGAVPAVRMAAHTGDARLRDEGNYMGPAVIRTARLRAIGHGGQILCSRTTAELAADDLPPTVTLADLGAHRLRDLGRPEHVYQVCHPGLRRDFPALRSLDAIPNNLPVHLTTFIGRDAELGELSALIAGHRLVTLTGTGGCGKTRLAARVAAEVAAVHADGAWWVELAALTDPSLVADTVLGVLSVPDGLGRSALQRLTAHLAAGDVLLVLDNCEHVLDACAIVSEAVLRACPGVTLLATSREALGVPGEVTWQVPPLTLPAAEAGPLRLDSLGSYDAVRLFVDRAVRARPNFTVTNETAPVVAEICTRLDGIPLAIELAAARVRLLSPQEILAGLQDRFRLLTGGARSALPRQQTLEASVAWSHDQLSDDERILFRRLAVFAGGFTLDAAEAVCAPGGDGPDRLALLDLLDGLVAKSLVIVDDSAGPGTRYQMLETIRQFAALALSRAEETAALRDAHLRFCLASAARMEERLIGPNPAVIRWAGSEQDNYRVALDWALAGPDPEAALNLARPLAFLLGHRGRIREARQWLERALALPGGPPVARGEALWMLSFLLWNWGDTAAGKDIATEMLELARAAGDARLEGRAHELFCWAYLFSDPVAAKASIDAARPLAEAEGDAWVLMDHACEVAFIAMRSDDHAEVARLVGDALAIAQRHGSDYFLYWNRFTEGMSALRQGRLPEARKAGEEGLRLCTGVGDALVMSLHEYVVAEVALAEGDPQAALERAERALVECARAGADVFLSNLLGTRARALMALAHPEARAAADTALQAAERLGDPWVHGPVALVCARILIETGELVAAAVRVDEARRSAVMMGSPWIAAVADHTAGLLAAAAGEADRAEDLHHLALAAAVAGGFALVAVDALEGIAAAAAAGESWEEAVRLIGATARRRDELGYRHDRAAATRAESAARHALGEEAYAASVAEGSALAIDAALAYATRARGERKRPSSGWASLTPTEVEVVKLLAQGLTNPQIGGRLFIGRGTVKTHLAHVFAKLGVTTRAELAAEATRRGL